VVFANSGMGEPLSPELKDRHAMMEEVLRQAQIEVISEIMTVASFSPGFEERNPAAFQNYKEIKMQNDPSAYVEIMRAVVEALDAPQDLSRLKCPVLIIAGENDGLMDKRVAKSMKESIGNAVLKMLPTGHAAALELPQEFNKAVLDFLKDLRWL
jgi:3-oxoadipate enol-lactonase